MLCMQMRSFRPQQAKRPQAPRHSHCFKVRATLESDYDTGTEGRWPLTAPLKCLQQLQLSNQQWLQHALQQPLSNLEGSECTLYILGVCFWAPLQHELVSQALQQLQPDEVLVEQPQTNSELLLPHPEWVQSVIDFDQCIEAVQQAHQQGQQWQQWQQQLLSLRAELSSSSAPTAKVGKDIMDPYESFGYYSGLDFIKQPGNTLEVLQSCGFLPGREVAAAAQYAQLHGARLRCIDAPLKLQERWVQGLISSFTDSLDEQAINSYAPLKDFRANQQVASTLPAAALEWDQQLAQAAADLQQQAASAAAAAQSSGGTPLDPAAALAAKQAAEQQALLLFKVSKATAAALLPPDAEQQADVLGRMSRLQPLKWRHFALRQQYMAQQMKEAAAMAAKQAQVRSSSSTSGSSSRKKPTFLVVVGRQHAAALHAAWSNPYSTLWRTNVPRSFAASVVEPPEASTGAAATTAAAGPEGRSSGAGDVPAAGTL